MTATAPYTKNLTVPVRAVEHAFHAVRSFSDKHQRLIACVSFAVAVALPLSEGALTVRAVFTAARDAGESASEADKLAAAFRAGVKVQRSKRNLIMMGGSTALFRMATGGCFS